MSNFYECREEHCGEVIEVLFGEDSEEAGVFKDKHGIVRCAICHAVKEGVPVEDAVKERLKANKQVQIYRAEGKYDFLKKEAKEADKDICRKRNQYFKIDIRSAQHNASLK